MHEAQDKYSRCAKVFRQNYAHIMRYQKGYADLKMYESRLSAVSSNWYINLVLIPLTVGGYAGHQYKFAA